MPIATCIVTGNVKNLLGSNVQDCTVRLSVLVPFFHGASFIAGEIEEVETDSSGNFSVACIETETVGHKISFAFEYSDGVASVRVKKYAVVVPNTTTADISALIAADVGTAGVSTFPAANVTVIPAGNLTSTNAQAALEELQGDIDGLNTLADGKIYVGDALNVATEVLPTGDVTISNLGVTAISSGVIVDADINATAAIVDTKLATLSTALKVANSATTAASANTASAIVARDGSGNFSAGTITANLIGNASGSAGSFTGSLVGDVTGTQGATVVSSVATSSAANVHSAELLANAATNANTASAIVKRDGSGDFVAGTITASLTGHASLDLRLTGGTLSGALDLGTHLITNVVNPVSAQDAATKNYVDGLINGLDWKEACNYASAAALATNVYSNGASGVGATLTGFSVGALTIDGNTPSVGNRVLVKNEVTAANNGIYIVTAVGSGIALYVLTRAADFNEAADLEQGDTVFINSGTANTATSWSLTTAGPFTIGSTSLAFSQVAGPGVLTPGTGISITGNTIAVSTVPAANGGTGASSAASTGIAHVASGTWSYSSIVNADVDAAAAIVDTKLATIATASKVSNSATTATSANTNSAIVARDSSGNFSAGTITASLTGNATNVTGTVAIANGGTGQTTKAAGFDALSPMSASGDVIYGGTSGTGTRLVKGNNGDVLTLAAGIPSWAAPAGGSSPTSQLTYDTPNGYGATNTARRRYTTSRVSTGSDLTYNDDSNLGAKVTVNTAGIYSVMMQEVYTGAGSIAIMVNDSVGTTGPGAGTYTYAQGMRAWNGPSNSNHGQAFWVGHLAVNDIISFAVQVSGNASSGADCTMSVCRIA